MPDLCRLIPQNLNNLCIQTSATLFRLLFHCLINFLRHILQGNVHGNHLEPFDSNMQMLEEAARRGKIETERTDCFLLNTKRVMPPSTIQVVWFESAC